jgi:hypothetical protein
VERFDIFNSAKQILSTWHARFEGANAEKIALSAEMNVARVKAAAGSDVEAKKKLVSLGHYSRISSMKRFLSFMPTALRIVRIAWAVRPWRPITCPRSLLWTRN